MDRQARFASVAQGSLTRRMSRGYPSSGIWRQADNDRCTSIWRELRTDLTSKELYDFRGGSDVREVVPGSTFTAAANRDPRASVAARLSMVER